MGEKAVWSLCTSASGSLVTSRYSFTEPWTPLRVANIRPRFLWFPTRSHLKTVREERLLEGSRPFTYVTSLDGRGRVQDEPEKRPEETVLVRASTAHFCPREAFSHQ